MAHDSVYILLSADWLFR